MNAVETEVQKKLVVFCKYLRDHVEKWKTILQESAESVESLCNQAEQLRHVEKAAIKELPDFKRTQQILLMSITSGIEREIKPIKIMIEKLKQTNEELKTKLGVLENSSKDLNWERRGPLVKGSPSQPELATILSRGLEFWTFFHKTAHKISELFKEIDIRNEKSMRSFEKALKIDLQDNRNMNFLALIQYVDDDSWH